MGNPIIMTQDSTQNYEDVLTLRIVAEQPGVHAAPSAVWFECHSVAGAEAQPPQSATVYDPQYHEITYLWDFGDSANVTPTTVLNMPDAWKDLNTAYGRRVAHVFNDPSPPGTPYTVTCYAYEPATRRFGSATIKVTVEDPKDTFADGRTIIFDSTGTGDPVNYPTANVQTTWTDAVEARRLLGGQPAVILVAPGEVITYDQASTVVTSTNWYNMRVGPLDPAGARPRFVSNSGRRGGGQNDAFFKDNNSTSIEAIFYGLHFQGEWDASKELGPVLRPLYVNKDSTTYEHLYLLHRCSFDGFEVITSTDRADGVTSYFMANDTYVTNWQNYGFIVGHNNVTSGAQSAIVGCSIAQHPDALSGGKKNGGFYNNHGPVRDYNSDHLFVSCCDLFSRNGWSQGGQWRGYSVTGDQACIRINTGANPGKFSVLDRVALEGHVWMEDSSSRRPHIPGNHLMDRVLQSLGPKSNLAEAILALHGGLTIRNLYAFVHDAPPASSEKLFRFIGSNNKNGAADNGPAGVRVYNSTFIDMRTDTNTTGLTVVPFSDLAGSTAFPFDEQIIENNVDFQPNRSTAVIADGPMDLDQPIEGFLTRHKGPRFNFLHVENIFSAQVAQGGSLFVPYSMITETQFNLGGVVDGPATNLAYWKATEGSDTAHQFQYDPPSGSDRMYFAQQGEIGVTFGPSGVTITNLSGEDWAAGRRWRLQLDRSSRLPVYDLQFDVSGRTLPLPGLNVNSPARKTGDYGLRAYDDYHCIERPSGNNSRGALQFS